MVSFYRYSVTKENFFLSKGKKKKRYSKRRALSFPSDDFPSRRRFPRRQGSLVSAVSPQKLQNRVSRCDFAPTTTAGKARPGCQCDVADRPWVVGQTCRLSSVLYFFFLCVQEPRILNRRSCQNINSQTYGRAKNGICKFGPRLFYRYLADILSGYSKNGVEKKKKKKKNEKRFSTEYSPPTLQRHSHQPLHPQITRLGYSKTES